MCYLWERQEDDLEKLMYALYAQLFSDKDPDYSDVNEFYGMDLSANLSLLAKYYKQPGRVEKFSTIKDLAEHIISKVKEYEQNKRDKGEQVKYRFGWDESVRISGLVDNAVSKLNDLSYAVQSLIVPRRGREGQEISGEKRAQQIANSRLRL